MKKKKECIKCGRKNKVVAVFRSCDCCSECYESMRGMSRSVTDFVQQQLNDILKKRR